MHFMALGSAEIVETYLEISGGMTQVGARITCPPNLRPAPGQYLAASAAGLQEPLPAALFPAGLEGDELIVAPPIPPGWTTGTHLSLRGPLGNGFRLPAAARRVALLGLEDSPARLLPLAFQALSRQASVALYARYAPPGLPLEVEILPLDQVKDALSWADYLAVDVDRGELSSLRAVLNLGLYGYPACDTQVLVVTEVPCGGLGECGVCAVPTRAGWRLACSDGPVFDWTQLEV